MSTDLPDNIRQFSIREPGPGQGQISSAEYDPIAVGKRPLAFTGKANADEARWICEKCGIVEPRWSITTLTWQRQSCACEKKQAIQREQEQWRLEVLLSQKVQTFSWFGAKWSDDSLLTQTFENFDKTHQIKAFDAVQAFLDNAHGTLILEGPPGVGKTHLLAALCNELRQHNLSRANKCRFFSAVNFFRALWERKALNEDDSDILEKAVTTPLLVIDDMDKVKWSDFVETTYFYIVNSRVNRKLPIALTTNDLKRLADYVGEAVYSRLQTGRMVIRLRGTDYRVEA